MIDAIIIRPNELVLKGGARPHFERLLLNAAAKRLASFGTFKIMKREGTIIAVPSLPLDDTSAGMAAAALTKTFGIAKIALAMRVPREVAAIAKAATEILTARGASSFKIETRRADKTYPMTSPEISAEVGALVLETMPNIRVNVQSPDMVIEVDVSADAAYVYATATEGGRGLPTGSSGNLIAMLSGGIDSPVAAWKAMRRGCRIIPVHFHSHPFTSVASIEKAKRLAAVLGDWQDGAKLALTPFAEVQQAIVARCDERLRVVLYRRMMLRIAERIARSEDAQGIVTGDSIGQVASQTLENLSSVNDAASMPVYRPLIGDDKDEIVSMARAIGTYDISIEPHGDCCSLFVPAHPATRSTIEAVRQQEARLDIDTLVRAALTKTETVSITGAPARASMVM